MSPPSSSRSSRKELLAAALLFLLVAVLLQWAGGAYKSEFGGHPDEAAHYVTGLMIRDYIAAGLPGNPMKFAKEYYDHYPKVALGNWPPVFYVIQSAWSLIVPPTRVSMLLLMATLSAGVALVTFVWGRRMFGFIGALTTASLVLLVPLAQRHGSMIMTEVPITLFVLLAVFYFGRYLDTQRAGDSVLFGVFASLAILTKGSGMFLALVPVLSILITGRLFLLKKISFWYPAPIVAVLCGPWTWKFRDVARAGWMESEPSLSFTKKALLFYPTQLVVATSVVIAVLAIVGLLAKLVMQRTAADAGRWAALASAAISLLIFHSIVPAGLENRHLLPAIPMVMLFAAAGVGYASIAASKRMPVRRSVVILGGAAVLAFFIGTFAIPQKGYAGFGQAAELLLEKAPHPKTVFLVSSDAQGEGMFIAEVAMKEKRPGHYVQRASKALASSTWSGSGYQSKFKNEQSLLEYLKTKKIAYVVVDTTMSAHNKREHHVLLQRTAATLTNNFVLEGSFPVQRKAVWTNELSVYRLRDVSTN